MAHTYVYARPDALATEYGQVQPYAYRCAVSEDPENPGYYRPVHRRFWRYVSSEGTDRLGHYTTQGCRDVWARRTRRGHVLVLTSGSGWWPSSTGGYDWTHRTVLEVATDPAATILASLDMTEDAEAVTA